MDASEQLDRIEIALWVATVILAFDILVLMCERIMMKFWGSAENVRRVNLTDENEEE